ncbi:MAG: hypothetical protein M1816_004359 [Peltula sp. TS41687]|nr:MAG: hypothetical protein M1816_004359 [Peltula sp. TS41687]
MSYHPVPIEVLLPMYGWRRATPTEKSQKDMEDHQRDVRREARKRRRARKSAVHATNRALLPAPAPASVLVQPQPPPNPRGKHGPRRKTKHRYSDPNDVTIIDAGWDDPVQLSDPSRGFVAPPHSGQITTRRSEPGSLFIGQKERHAFYARHGPFPFDKLPSEIGAMVLSIVLEFHQMDAWNNWAVSRRMIRITNGFTVLTPRFLILRALDKELGHSFSSYECVKAQFKNDVTSKFLTCLKLHTRMKHPSERDLRNVMLVLTNRESPLTKCWPELLARTSLFQAWKIHQRRQIQVTGPQEKGAAGRRGRQSATVRFHRVIVDETHKISSTSSGFAKRLWEQGWLFVTGTPLPKGPAGMQLA